MQIRAHNDSRVARSRTAGLEALTIALLGCLCPAARLSAQEAGPAMPPAPAARLLPRAIEATPLTIEPGDLINLQVFDTPEVSGNHRIGPSGAIDLPGTGEITLAGLTPLEGARLVETRLRDAQIMLDPHVSITVTEYTTAGITVLGEVKSPGTYSLLGPQSLYTALAAAGGVTSKEGPTITVAHRSDPSHPVVIRVNTPNYAPDQQAMVVQPGDTVLVSQARPIYVIGDVTHPGEYYINNGQPLRTLNVLALAQGLKDTAAASHASIIRTSATGVPETIPVNLTKVERNQAVDPVLEPSDILVVPRSGAKQFEIVALPGVVGAIANAAALALIYR